MRRHFHLSVLALLFSLLTLPRYGAALETSPTIDIKPTDFSDFDVGDVKICPEGNLQCQKVTCFDLCLAAGEAAADCPLYCNTYTERVPLRQLNHSTASRH